MRRPPRILDQRPRVGVKVGLRVGKWLVESAEPAIAARSHSAALVNEQESLGVEPLSLARAGAGRGPCKAATVAHAGVSRPAHQSATALAEQMEVTVTVTVSPEESLLFAARVLQTAADQAGICQVK